jgi:hypothetical protein
VRACVHACVRACVRARMCICLLFAALVPGEPVEEQLLAGALKEPPCCASLMCHMTVLTCYLCPGLSHCRFWSCHTVDLLWVILTNAAMVQLAAMAPPLYQALPTR